MLNCVARGLTSKCVYTSVLERCEFCLIRGIRELCHKIPSEQKQTPVHRSVADPVSEFLGPEDALILHHGYSDDFFCRYDRIGTIFRALSVTFRRGIENDALRFAMLAYIADTVAGNAFAAKREYYQVNAQRCLGSHLKDLSRVQYADLFAAYIFCYRLPWDSIKAIRHYRGCLSLHKFLSAKTAPPTGSYHLFTTYGPFIFDELTVWLNTELSVQANRLSSEPIRLSFPAFDNLLQHFSPFTSPDLSLIESVSFYTMQYCMDLLYLSIQDVVGCQLRREGLIDLMSARRLIAVKEQFYSLELQQFLMAAEVVSDEALSRGSINEMARLIKTTCLGLCIRMTLLMLDYGDILPALDTKEVIHARSKLTSRLKALVENKNRTDILCVFIAGLSPPQNNDSSGATLSP